MDELLPAVETTGLLPADTGISEATDAKVAAGVACHPGRLFPRMVEVHCLVQ
jgi:hypothetical protein